MTKQIKTLILGAIAIVAAFVFGYLFANFVNFPSLASLIYATVSGIVFLAVFLMQAMLLSGFFKNLSIIALEVVAMSAFFLFTAPNLILLIGIIIALAALAIAYQAGQGEVRGNLELNFLKISRLTIGIAGIALAMFASFAYFSLFDLQDPIATKKTLEAVVKPAEPIASNYIPDFSVTDSLTKIAFNLLPPELKLAPLETRNAIIRESSAQLAEIFSEFTGIQAAPGDTVVDIVYKATVGRVISQTPLVQTLVLIAAAIFMFFLIKFILFFLDWFAILLGYFIYKLLEASGFFKVELQNRPKKTIIL